MQLKTLALAAALAALAVAPFAPAVHTFGGAAARGDRSQLVEVVYTGDAEPTFVARQIESFGEKASLQVRLHPVSSLPELLAAVSASDAAELVVISHGATAEASADSGLLLRGSILGQEVLLDAMRQSSAQRFFVAGCGLDLPASIDGREVASFTHRVDQRLAAVTAIAHLGGLYNDETVAEVGPLFDAFVAGLGTPEELGALILTPQQALDPVPREYYGETPPCYESSSNCQESSSDDHNVKNSAQHGSGGWAWVPPYMTADVGAMINNFGFIRIRQDVFKNGQWWDAEIDIGPQNGDQFGCWEIMSWTDVTFPGYRFVKEFLHRIPGVKVPKAELFEVALCGELFLMIKKSGEVGVGGALKLQAGANLWIPLCFGWWCNDYAIKFFIGFAGMVGCEGGTIDTSNPENFRCEFFVDVSFVAEGKLGWIDGGITLHIIRFEHPLCINWVWLRGCSGGANGQQQAPQRMLLTTPGLNGLRNDPALASRLSAAVGTDITNVAPGTALNVGHPAVCRAIYGDEVQCDGTGNPQPLDGNPPQPAGCNEVQTPGTGNGQDPPRAHVQLCEYPNGGVSAAASTTGSNLLELSDPNSPLGNAFHTISPQQHCHNLGGTQFTCHTIGMFASVADIAADRVGNGVQASVLVDLDAVSAATVVDDCKDVSNPLCPAGSFGVNGQVTLLGETVNVALTPNVLSTVQDYDATTNRIVVGLGLADGMLCHQVTSWLLSTMGDDNPPC